jgi:hypothetical protein
MATPVWAPGYVAKANVNTLGGGGATDLRITGWSWEEKITAMLTTNTASGAVAERLAGVLDGSGDVTFNYDLANQNHKTPYLIVPGAVGVISLFVSGVVFFQVPFLIESVGYKVVVDGKVEVSCKILMNSAAGTYVRPL